jgi:ubiquinone/menaquinone biosynthesis C-methylase UbiE
MTKPRAPETDEGIRGEFNVQAYDEMLRAMRDRGWIETNLIIKSGIVSGHALEIGPGPGYLGLEWLKKTQSTRLTGADINPEMIARATANAETYDPAARAEYVLADAQALPFADDSFEGIFSNGSLHEWAQPAGVLREMAWVLRPGGLLVLSDLRRDMVAPVKWSLWVVVKPKIMRKGLLTSIAASYTPAEARTLLDGAALDGAAQIAWEVKGNPLGFVARGVKPAAA